MTSHDVRMRKEREKPKGIPEFMTVASSMGGVTIRSKAANVEPFRKTITINSDRTIDINICDGEGTQGRTVQFSKQLATVVTM